MKAITTKFIGATNYRGSRIKATAEGGHSLTISYPHEANQGADAHAVAALALCRRLGWDGELIAGGTAAGYVFVFASGDRYTVNLSESAIKAARERLKALLAAIA